MTPASPSLAVLQFVTCRGVQATFILGNVYGFPDAGRDSHQVWRGELAELRID